jgi:hypothetical protein
MGRKRVQMGNRGVRVRRQAAQARVPLQGESKGVKKDRVLVLEKGRVGRLGLESAAVTADRPHRPQEQQWRVPLCLRP